MESTTPIWVFCALVIVLAARAASAASSDAIQPDSVWTTGAGETLTILERKGDWFQGRFEGDWDNVVREVSGTVKDNQIFWLGKDTTVIRGYGSGDCYGTFDGDKFYLNSYNKDGTWHSTFHQNQIKSPATVPSAPTAGSTPWIGVFSGEVDKADGWTFLPLRTPVPAAIRDNIAVLAAALRAEAAKTPQASIEAYTSADSICRFLSFDLADREAILKRIQQRGQGNVTPELESFWETRCARYQTTIQAEYERFVAAVNQSGKPKALPGAGNFAFASFPSVPVPAPAPASAPQVASNSSQKHFDNPLDRGAYDRHSIWRNWWGPSYYYVPTYRLISYRRQR